MSKHFFMWFKLGLPFPLATLSPLDLVSRMTYSE